MEDIKLKATPIKEMIILFSKIELSLVEYVKRHTRENKTIILSTNLLNRLTAVEPSLKNDTIYTYKKNIKEILSKNHPIHKIYTKIELKEIKSDMKHGTHVDRYVESDFHITVINEKRIEQIRTNTNPQSLFDEEFAIYTPFKDFNNSWFEHESFGIEDYIEKTGMHGYVRKYVLAYIRYMEENPKKSTDIIAQEYAVYITRDRIEHFVSSSLRQIERKRNEDPNELKINNYDISEIYCIIKNLAEASKKELTYFVTGGKSALPYFKGREKPIASISIIKEGDILNFFNNGGYTEIYIVTNNKIIHARESGDLGSWPIIKSIEFKDGQKIIIGGEEFNLDEDFLTKDQISLIEILTYDDENISLNTKFNYDKKTFKRIAIEDGGDIYDYVLAREGLYIDNTGDRCWFVIK